jgi:glycosyltransferase involved in cell wall biosynthesis
VHNAERYVEAAIRSALASDLCDLEIVAVDDGSTDRSLDVMLAIPDPRLVLIRQDSSGGPSRPRNVGIRQARGAYIALLDADDLIKPDKLSGAVAALDQNPGAALAFGNYERIDAEGHVLERSTLSAYPKFAQLQRENMADGWQLIPQAEFARGLLYENFIGTSGVTLRRSALDRVGLFDEQLTYSEDRDLWFRLAHTGSALYSDNIGHSYRVFPGSLTFRPGTRQALHRITVLERERRRWSKAAEVAQIDRLLAENFSALAYAQRKSGRRLASATNFLRAFRKVPQSRFLRSALGSLVLMPEARP